MKAALYCRISQDHAGQSLGVTRQQEDCAELAGQLGWDVAEVYIDNDLSATSGKPRPAYRRMLADLDAGTIEAVVAWHPDRLYRRAVDLGELVDVCKRNNTQVATVKAGTIDLTTPTGRLVAGLLAQVATYEGEAKADRWKRSIRQRREQGHPPGWGPRMYGYTREGEVIDTEAEAIRYMAREVVEGSSLTGLARRLNARGLTTSLGNQWAVASIRKLLTNPRLIGHSTLNGEMVGAGQWEPILDEETFEQARAILATRTGTTRKPRVALLLGLIYCGNDDCRQRLVTGGRGRRGNAPSQRIYRCPRIPGRREGCGSCAANAEAVEDVVESAARTLLSDERVRRRVTELRSSAGATGLVGEINTLESRLLELERQLDEPGTPVATILRAIDRAKQRLEGSRRQLASAAPTALPTNGADWPGDLGRRRQLIDLVVSRVDLMRASGRPGAFDPKRVRVVPR